MTTMQGFGLAFVLLAAVILSKQAQARHCSRHSRLAGVLAWLLALGCAGGGTWLLLTGG